MNLMIFILIDVSKKNHQRTFTSMRYSHLWSFSVTRSKEKNMKRKTIKENLLSSFLKSCLSLTETTVILDRQAQRLLHSQAKIMNVLVMKQAFMNVLITKKSVPPSRSSFQRPNLDVKVRRNEYITILKCLNCNFILIVFNAVSNKNQTQM